MTELTPRFPEYGDGGDAVGARRGRRAFRLCVFAVALFTMALWFVENFLRYDPAERIYISALTLPTESARAMLRNAVAADAERHADNRTPRYAAALAVREEADDVLAAFEEAVRLDPRNADLIIRYGCRLYQHGKYQEAREAFRDAQRLNPENALPTYLEAAATASLETGSDRLGEALTLIAQTNNSGRGVTFPRPIWSAQLPTAGVWYARLRRDALDESCAPLYRLSGQVLDHVQSEVESRHVQYVGAWLDTLQRMGERVAQARPPASITALAGIHIQVRALDALAQVQILERGEPRPEVLEQRESLAATRDAVQAFEDARPDRIEAMHERFTFPMMLILSGLGVLGFVYVGSFLLARFAAVPPARWTVPHASFGKAVMGGGPLLLLALLTLTMTLNVDGGGETGAVQVFTGVWGLLIFGLVAFGAVYPIALLNQRGTLSKRGSDLEPALDSPARRRARAQAYLALMRRYYGVLMGFTLCAICAWTIAFRSVTGLYPWQLKLLTSGLTEEEMQLVTRLLGG